MLILAVLLKNADARLSFSASPFIISNFSSFRRAVESVVALPSLLAAETLANVPRRHKALQFHIRYYLSEKISETDKQPGNVP